jgi:hypothetical protein
MFVALAALTLGAVISTAFCETATCVSSPTRANCPRPGSNSTNNGGSACKTNGGNNGGNNGGDNGGNNGRNNRGDNG